VAEPLATPERPIDFLLHAARHLPDALALSCEGVDVPYRTYLLSVSAVARQLSHAEGGVVAVLLRNGIALPISLFAAQAAGATACPLNPDYTVRELSEMLGQAKPSIVITHPALAETVHASLPPSFAGDIMILPDDVAGWIKTLPTNADLPPLPPADAHAMLQFTGGTTGRAKGVLLTHKALATNIVQREAVLPTCWGDERIVCTMPLFHSFAIAMGLFMAVQAGGSLHILPRYRPDWLLDTIETKRITRLPAGPTIFNSLLQYDGSTRERVASLRCAYSGSAPLSMATLERWEALTGTKIYEGYGQSEAGPILTYHGPGMPQKQGSVGPPLPGTDIAIVDTDTRERRLSAGEVGEVVARGPQLMTGYLDNPAATAEALRDGWLHTGDIGRIDEDGYLFIEDRLKDLVIVSGYNVYPREIDEVIAAVPGVVEAATVGVPDSYRGEVLHAFYNGDPDEDAIRAHCAANLVKYKRPSVFARLPALPRTTIGKVDKVALRKLAMAGTQHVAG
jgi:long-chain acyl-CoA synthetase